jgi:hypothetical protein
MMPTLVEEDRPIITRDPNWRRASFESTMAYGETLQIRAPVDMSQILDPAVTAIDVARCTYHGWEEYGSESTPQLEFDGMFVAHLQRRLRWGDDLENFPYHQKFHRLTTVRPGVFQGLMQMLGKDNDVFPNSVQVSRLEFSVAGEEIAATLTRARPDFLRGRPNCPDERVVTAFRLVHS